MHSDPVDVSLIGLKGCCFFHTQLWFLASDRDFRRFESDFRCFLKLSQEKNILEQTNSIMDGRAERKSTHGGFCSVAMAATTYLRPAVPFTNMV